MVLGRHLFNLLSNSLAMISFYGVAWHSALFRPDCHHAKFCVPDRSTNPRDSSYAEMPCMVYMYRGPDISPLDNSPPDTSPGQFPRTIPPPN